MSRTGHPGTPPIHTHPRSQGYVHSPHLMPTHPGAPKPMARWTRTGPETAPGEAVSNAGDDDKRLIPLRMQLNR